jgi:hypothetical protein
MPRSHTPRRPVRTRPRGPAPRPPRARTLGYPRSPALAASPPAPVGSLAVPRPSVRDGRCRGAGSGACSCSGRQAGQPTAPRIDLLGCDRLDRLGAERRQQVRLQRQAVVEQSRRLPRPVLLDEPKPLRRRVGQTTPARSSSGPGARRAAGTSRTRPAHSRARPGRHAQWEDERRSPRKSHAHFGDILGTRSVPRNTPETGKLLDSQG